jgi:hypothetical protein
MAGGPAIALVGLTWFADEVARQTNLPRPSSGSLGSPTRRFELLIHKGTRLLNDFPPFPKRQGTKFPAPIERDAVQSGGGISRRAHYQVMRRRQ